MSADNVGTQVQPDPDQTSVAITGVWLRRMVNVGSSAYLEVLAEIDEKWYRVIGEIDDGPISHIVEIGGIISAPLDPLTSSE